MATTKAPLKPVAKKAPAPVAKTVAPKKTAEPKAPKEPKPPKDESAAAAKTAERDAARQARAVRDAELTAKIVEMRSNGEKWPEVAEALEISQGKAQLLMSIHEGAAKRVPTPKDLGAAIVNDRDVNHMSWDQIGAQYGLRKSATQRMYAEKSGKNPSESYVGKGGRFFSFEGAIASQRAAFQGAPKASGRPAPAAKAPKAAPGTPVFAADAPKAEVAAALDGKVITTAAGGKIKIRAGSPIKVGTEKSGARIVQITDASNGGTRTVKLDQIVKVAAK